MRQLIRYIQAPRHTKRFFPSRQRAREISRIDAVTGFLVGLTLLTLGCSDSGRDWETEQTEILASVLAQGVSDLDNGEMIPVHPRFVRVDPVAGPLPGDALAHYDDHESTALRHAISSVPGYAPCQLDQAGLCSNNSRSTDIDFVMLSEVIFEDDHATVWLIAVDVGPPMYSARYYRIRSERLGGEWRVTSSELAGWEN